MRTNNQTTDSSWQNRTHTHRRTTGAVWLLYCYVTTPASSSLGLSIAQPWVPIQQHGLCTRGAEHTAGALVEHTQCLRQEMRIQFLCSRSWTRDPHGPFLLRVFQILYWAAQPSLWAHGYHLEWSGVLKGKLIAAVSLENATLRKTTLFSLSNVHALVIIKWK